MAKSKYSDETKLKAMGMIHSEIPLKEIGEELSVAYPKLLAWRKELKESIESGNLASLVNVEEIIIKEVIDKVKDDVIKLDPEQGDLIEGELIQLTDEIDGYKALSIDLQNVATKLAKKIDALSDMGIGAIELESLVASLAKLQEAFFNKNVTQIAVFPGGESSATSVNKFKGLQKA